MFGRDMLRPGMMVHTVDGQKLGKILELGTDSFVIEKGTLFKKEYLCEYSLVSDVRGDDVIISRAYSDIGKEHRDTSTTDFTQNRSDERFATSSSDVAIPVVEEELDVIKRDRSAGGVRVHKDVITEQKTVTVPVTREEVRVERVPVSEGQYAAGDARIGEGGDVTVPVREEEIEIRKRPVVREEVRLRKDKFEEQRVVADSVRKEEVTIENDEAAPRKAPLDSDYDPKTRY